MMNRDELKERLRELGLPELPAEMKVRRAQLPELEKRGIYEHHIIDLGIEIVSDEDLEADDDLILICASAQKSMFIDNIFTACDGCGGAIQHRPNAPERARKLCFKCAGKALLKERNSVVREIKE
jgi:hypothetical protein